MTAYILRRILYLIPTFFGATFLAFLIIQMAPGDYLTQLELDPKVTPETIARLRVQFGLDRPIYEQYLLWMNNLLHLNLGYSFAYQAPVLEVIWPRVVNSMVIVIPSTLLLYLVAIPVGVYGAVRQYSLGDRILSFLAYIGLSVPSFFLALIAIYVLLQIKFRTGTLIFPVSGMTSSGFEQMPPLRQILDIAWHAVVPVLVATANDIAGLSRLMRGQMLEVLAQDYIRTARAKGLSERVVLYKHALRNALIPIVTLVGLAIPGVLGGATITETIFSYPGMGRAIFDALVEKDYNVAMAALAFLALMTALFNLLADLAYAVVDPRIRYS